MFERDPHSPVLTVTDLSWKAHSVFDPGDDSALGRDRVAGPRRPTLSLRGPKLTRTSWFERKLLG